MRNFDSGSCTRFSSRFGSQNDLSLSANGSQSDVSWTHGSNPQMPRLLRWVTVAWHAGTGFGLVECKDFDSHWEGKRHPGTSIKLWTTPKSLSPVGPTQDHAT